MYAISFDGTKDLLSLRLEGFWTVDVMDRFRTEMLGIVARAARTHPRLAVLSDCRTYPVQSTDVMVGWTQLLGGEAALIAQPYAIVVGSMLNKLQVQRSLDAPNVQAFTDVPAAEEWLAIHPLRR